MTEFVDLLAVEAWDAWFRWRERGELRDTTIDATWQRVAQALASVEGAQAAQWTQRFTDAFASWQLLPDEALLRTAGITDMPPLSESPAAVLNLATLLRYDSGSQPGGVDTQRVRRLAGLAVRMLDNALLLSGSPPGACLRVGLIGAADAFERLGLAYDSAPARQLAADAAAALAEGSLQAAISLAAARGRVDDGNPALARIWHHRGMPSDLIAEAGRWGVRHLRLTAISPHPRLALLANGASDALEPSMSRGWGRPGCGLDELQPLVAAPLGDDAGDEASVLGAQLELRAAVQPWIDAPIDYPLLLVQAPERLLWDEIEGQARQLQLPPPRWQQAVRLGHDHSN